jgi:predicted transcriptional regulator
MNPTTEAAASVELETAAPAVASDAGAHAAMVVAAYQVEASARPALLSDVIRAFSAETAAAEPAVAAEPLVPAVPVEQSITTDYLVCLEDGKRFKSLKRHLMTDFGLTPEQYRAKWSLPADYPMVAPDYASRRSAMAIAAGLGRKPAPAALDLAA